MPGFGVSRLLDVGKLGPATPVTEAPPAMSTATLLPKSSPVPPRYVEYHSDEPVALSLVRNASFCPPLEPWEALARGKFVEEVAPVM